MCNLRSTPQLDAERALLEAIRAAVAQDDHAEVSRLDQALRALHASSEIASTRLSLFRRQSDRQD